MNLPGYPADDFDRGPAKAIVSIAFIIGCVLGLWLTCDGLIHFLNPVWYAISNLSGLLPK